MNTNNSQNHNNKNPKKKFQMNEKTMTTLLYVGAAILVVVILSVSIFAFASRKTETKPTPESTATTTKTEVTTKTPTTTQTPVTTAPTTTKKVTTVDKPTASTPNYVTPVEGKLLKNHDSETLVYSVTMNDYRVHLGIDVEAPVGSAVYSIADGTIKRVYQDYMMGTCIEIEHKNGIISCYKNLGETLPDGIKEGATVTSGQLIAGVGETAIIEQCDEAHLHFEIKKNGESVNPLDYISYGKNTETMEK